MDKQNLEKLKERFLTSEFFMLSWAAAVQHNKIWKEKFANNDSLKKKFKNEIFEFLKKEIMPNYYKKEISDSEHIKNIEKIQKLSEEKGNKLNIGICQKLLNMMCKYYWCAGWIFESPHLPIDRMNIQTVNKNSNGKEKLSINWTQIEKMEDYKNVIDFFKQVVKPESLSAWELENWKRQNF